MPIDPHAHERARLMTGEEPPFGVTSEHGDIEQARNLPPRGAGIAWVMPGYLIYVSEKVNTSRAANVDDR
ncbi:hypothetical protein [Bradyrhizobium sp. LMG 9283]|uniref:hypothetical protein n=1 Tax=Bradyrhizobium sp. LMG 9283 TaxID=592064 RepID=UPI00388FA0D1